MKIKISISSDGAQSQVIDYLTTTKFLGVMFEIKPMVGKPGTRGVIKLRNPKKLSQIDAMIKSDLKDLGFSLVSKVNYGEDRWIRDGTNVVLGTDGSCYYQVDVPK